MRIGMTTFGCDGGRSGIGRYTVQLLREFAALTPPPELEVALHRREQGALLGPEPAFPVVPVGDRPQGPVRNLLWHQLALPGLCRRRGWEVLFLPAANRRLTVRSPIPAVGTVHDLSSLHVQGKYDAAHEFYIRQVMPRMVRRLDRVITVSHASARDIVEYAGVPAERVHVVPLAADPALYRPRHPEEFAGHLHQRYGIARPYLLYVARLEHPGKNHVRLIRAFDRLLDRLDAPLQLVLVGPDWDQAEVVHQEACRARHRQRILFPGFLDEGDLPLVYAGARALVFPSLYEGFGLPALEAMSAGTPVACANCSSLPEVVGGAGLLFDPRDEDAILAAMETLVTEDAVHRRCREQGLARAVEFSWARTARETLEILALTGGAAGAPRRAA